MSKADELGRLVIERQKGLDRSAEYHRRARKMNCDASGALENGNLEAAQRLMQQTETMLLSAIAVCVYPNVPSKEASELAIRVLGSNSVLFKSSGPPLTNERLAKGQEARFVGGRIELLLDKIAKSRDSSMTAKDIIRNLSEGEWDAAEAASFYSEYLTKVREAGTLNQQREGLRLFSELVKSVEPKVSVHVGNRYDSVTLEEAKEIQQRMAEKLLEAAGVTGEA